MTFLVIIFLEVVHIYIGEIYNTWPPLVRVKFQKWPLSDYILFINSSYIGISNVLVILYWKRHNLRHLFLEFFLTKSLNFFKTFLQKKLHFTYQINHLLQSHLGS